ncbi:MAG: MMPL family transporter [Sporocytophaga sp.]|uniref:efflux RND transporter permease subunit n=1 Tax=Sporocytophaga sp. TaxID=2231183 RepID=UPI001B23392E|nr:MMPL family transporter [Sporocytophaga sp.]MBO9700337.1 MMPL family transporter [Sporocytophaga sp.]
MWSKLSSLIIKSRVWLLLITVLFTAFMGYQAKKIEITYDFIKVVPDEDPDLIYFKEFQKTFGEDGNILAIGLKNDNLYEYKTFAKYQQLAKDLAKVEGVTGVIALPELMNFQKDTVNKKFAISPVFTKEVNSQAELDSLLKTAEGVKVYENLIFNKKTGATLLAVTIDKDFLNSAKRTVVANNILNLTEKFSQESSIKMHYAGLPYVRAIMVSKVKDELNLFLGLAVLVTCIFLFIFFRSFFAVFFTFLVIMITVLWTLGFIVVLGYKITLLTGMLPALIIIISIPNCIYMFNKYHQEFRKHGNKIKAISRIIEKVGFLTFMTNINTAVGFFVLLFTDISIIREFGMVAGIVSVATFIITLIVIPSLLLFLPEPSKKQLKHLDFKLFRQINTFLEGLVMNKRKWIYIGTVIVLAVSVWGIYKIKAVSYMVDDLPENSHVKSDLGFFEQNFKGVMPLEIVVDLGKKNGIKSISNLKKLEELETYLKEQEYVSPPLSILNVVKGAVQAFYNGDPEQYRLPTNREAPFITKYLGKKSQENTLKSFVDSTGQYVRFTCKVADIGTTNMNILIKDNIQKKADEIFADKHFKTHITGTTLLFLKGNEYLINDLKDSLILAFILISLMMAFIFTDIRMIIISLIPNIVPMVITAGIMGIFHIALKPSTALIFSIAFGISIDSTIHYLSKFKQELKNLNGNVFAAVIKSLEETGVSMIYTSMVLFGGFVIFSFSQFGGTIALGVLTSLTLFFAMITNLILLPALLITFVSSNQKKEMKGFKIIKNLRAKRLQKKAENDEETKQAV